MRPVSLAKVLATGALLLVVGCRGKPEAEATALVPTFAEERLKLTALELRLGEDAYRQPEVEAILRALTRIPKEAKDWEEAVKLTEFLRAKRRLAAQATSPAAPEKSARQAPSMGPLQMTGAAPTEDAELARSEGVKVGSTRADLLAAFGECLVRQTWFRGVKGGAATELFHVAPGCRARLKPRIFTVANDKVIRVAPGTLDNVMTEPSRDNPELVER